MFLLIKVVKTFIGERDVPAISREISHVAGFRLATLAYTQQHAVVNTNLQNRGYTTNWKAAKSKYIYRTKPVADPGDTITVTSSLGASTTITVKHK